MDHDTKYVLNYYNIKYFTELKDFEHFVCIKDTFFSFIMDFNNKVDLFLYYKSTICDAKFSLDNLTDLIIKIGEINVNS